LANFKYRALTENGKEVSGVIEAFDEFEAVDAIKRNYGIVTHIVRVDETKLGVRKTITMPKIKQEHIALMCSQFSIILKAGMPIVRCVELIAAQTTSRELRLLLEQVAEDVSTGYGLAQSFENKGAKQLPVTFIETIRAGEESGTLETSFAKLHTYFDKSAKTQKKVKSAMMYPAFLLVLVVVVIGIVLVVAMPVFLDMFKELGTELPGPTKLLMSMSDFFVRFWPALVIGILALVIGLKLWSKTEKGKMTFARLQLRIPVFKNIVKMKGASQLANTLSTMLSAGLPIVRAVAICARTLDNYYFSTQLAAAVPSLEEGIPLGRSLDKCECFPSLLVEMAAVGDETGSLENTLDTIGEYYDSETEIVTKQALSALEPAITVIMGVIIGFVVIALYLPMFNMYGNM